MRVRKKKEKRVNLNLKAYKKNGCWYINDPDNGYSEDDNMLVAGVPEVIEMFAGISEKASIKVSTEGPGIKLELFNDNVAGGVEYKVDLGIDKQIIWLCKVFWFYFSKAPEVLYVNISGVP